MFFQLWSTVLVGKETLLNFRLWNGVKKREKVVSFMRVKTTVNLMMRRFFVFSGGHW